MSETAVATQVPLTEQYTDAVIRLAEINTERVQSMDYEDRRSFREQVGVEATALLDRLGVDRYDVIENYERSNPYITKEFLELERAADVAAEAFAFGFDLSLPDEEMHDKVGAMIQDYLDFTEDQVMTGRNTHERYTERRRAKHLLIESAARELSRRNGIEDNLVVDNVKRLQEATGLPFAMRRAGFMAVVTERHQVLPKPEWMVRRDRERTETWYYIPELAGPQTPHSGGWVPGRIGSFVLDARYTGGKLPQ